MRTCAPSIAFGSNSRFPIPMRGNEFYTVKLPRLNYEVSDPHEG